MAKNPMGKTRPVENPYEVWRAGDWEWRVLKKWQADDFKPFARWYCSVTSPHTFGMADLGDTYAAEVMSAASLVTAPDDGGPEMEVWDLERMRKARKVLAEMRRLSGGMVG